MASFAFSKVVSALPGVLTANTIYAVRVGAGFDLYISDMTGAAAHKVNSIGPETVFALTGVTPAINAENGTIQTWTLSANASPTVSLASGSSVTLMVDDGTGFTITWPAISWVGGSAPTVPTTGYAGTVLWKIGTTIYGKGVGNA